MILLNAKQYLDEIIYCLGTTNGKRGRKPAATVPAGEVLMVNGTGGSPVPPQPTTPRLDDMACRNKNVFKGKLSHASPILDPTNSKEKITVYFAALKSEEAPEPIKQEDGVISDEPAKSLALQRIFTKVKCKILYFICYLMCAMM